METQGQFAPATTAAVRDRYESLRPLARRLVREVAAAMELSAEEYEERVTDSVVETAREVLFASELTVHVGTRTEFETWLADRADDPAVVEVGSEHVDNVVWHHAAPVETVVAATYQNERTAAIESLRRQALGRCYRDVI